LGAIFYLLMDIAIHWGLLRHLKGGGKANAVMVVSAIALNIVVLIAFIAINLRSDQLVIWAAAPSFSVIVGFEYLFFRRTMLNKGAKFLGQGAS